MTKWVKVSPELLKNHSMYSQAHSKGLYVLMLYVLFLITATTILYFNPTLFFEGKLIYHFNTATEYLYFEIPVVSLLLNSVSLILVFVAWGSKSKALYVNSLTLIVFAGILWSIALMSSSFYMTLHPWLPAEELMYAQPYKDQTILDFFYLSQAFNLPILIVVWFMYGTYKARVRYMGQVNIQGIHSLVHKSYSASFKTYIPSIGNVTTPSEKHRHYFANPNQDINGFDIYYIKYLHPIATQLENYTPPSKLVTQTKSILFYLVLVGLCILAVIIVVAEIGMLYYRWLDLLLG